MLLAQQGRDSMPLGQAVKYLHAARFDEARADEIFKNYEVSDAWSVRTFSCLLLFACIEMN